MAKSQYISDPINISIEHSGDILVLANFNALIKSHFFNSCFTFYPLIFGHIFGTHKHLINLLLELSVFFTFNSYSFSFIAPSFLLKKLLTSILISRNDFNFSSSTTLCVTNVCCDPASNNNFIAPACVSFLSVTNAFAVCSKMFVLLLTRHVISSYVGLSLTLFGLHKAVL